MGTIEFYTFRDKSPLADGRQLFTAYFLTDEELFKMAADIIQEGGLNEIGGKYCMKIMGTDKRAKVYYTDVIRVPVLIILRDYKRAQGKMAKTGNSPQSDSTFKS